MDSFQTLLSHNIWVFMPSCARFCVSLYVPVFLMVNLLLFGANSAFQPRRCRRWLPLAPACFRLSSISLSICFVDCFHSFVFRLHMHTWDTLFYLGLLFRWMPTSIRKGWMVGPRRGFFEPWVDPNYCFACRGRILIQSFTRSVLPVPLLLWCFFFASTMTFAFYAAGRTKSQGATLR